MSTSPLRRAGPTPTVALRVPESLSKTGIRPQILYGLALKILYLSGECSVLDLADRMHVSLAVGEEIFWYLRREQLCEVTGMVGNVHRLVSTSKGQARAIQLLDISGYTGPAPVSLRDYASQVRAQSICNMDVRAADLERIFSDLVINPSMLSQLGAAIQSGRAIMLYGPTGTGKTTVAERLSRVSSESHVWIPHAVEVDGEIVCVYDPVVHRSVAPQSRIVDARWEWCQRPKVLVGGELSLEMLDLGFNTVTKFYNAPVQMKANNGVLIVDDFGRQRVQPFELLNRWVVPLDRKIDFLGLTNGKKIEIPFDVVVIFSTNLNPTELVDPTFLRRIQTKIKLEPVSSEAFHEIFRRVCAEFRLTYEPTFVDKVIEAIDKVGEPLRPCYPRDLINQVCSAAQYERRPPRLDPSSLQQAISAYFVA